jgi:hypothetical protein
LQFSKGKIKINCRNRGIKSCNNTPIKRWGQSQQEANRSTTTKKEAVPTSCWFEKPAASPKDYFCWLMLLFVVKSSIPSSRVCDAQPDSIRWIVKIAIISINSARGQKKKLLEPWDQMLQQHANRTIVAVSKRGKSQQDEQKQGSSNKLPL